VPENLVVFRVSADPEPHEVVPIIDRQRPMMQTDPN
jgi:hypothetical protein